MRKFFEIGGLVAAVVLIAFGVTAIVMGVNGRSTVQDSLKLEQITGSPDMSPSAIAAEAKKAGLPASIDLPTVDVAGKPINTGERARAFASYMRIHTLEANGRPVDNAARNIWVTETALTTALNTSYMAEQLALFGIVVGVALLLAGIGFGILAIGGALRNPDSVLTTASQKAKAGGAKPVPSV
jgi:hypothetical protein